MNEMETVSGFTPPPNAALMAAAPALYDACERSEEFFRRMTNAPLGTRLVLRREALAALRSALALARGESQP